MHSMFMQHLFYALKTLTTHARLTRSVLIRRYNGDVNGSAVLYQPAWSGFSKFNERADLNKAARYVFAKVLENN